MKTQVQQFCEKHGACSDGAKFARQFPTLAEVYDACPRGDWLWWMIRKGGFADKILSVKVAIACAEHVLPVFEKRFPDDDRPRRAIQAAKDFLDGKITAASAAAYAADAAAYAASAAAYVAAYAAADATYAEPQRQADKIRELVGRNPFV